MEIVLILDNIRSLYNVGSIFRSADAFGVREIICAGYTPTPDHPELKKTSLGAEMTVNWRVEEILAAIKRLKNEDYAIVALETGGSNIASYVAPRKIALIIGNETEGITEEFQSAADIKLEIPMLGQKESLNVSVAVGIALYALQCKRL